MTSQRVTRESRLVAGPTVGLAERVCPYSVGVGKKKGHMKASSVGSMQSELIFFGFSGQAVADTIQVPYGDVHHHKPR
jgi:hypothetical protein